MVNIIRVLVQRRPFYCKCGHNHQRTHARSSTTDKIEGEWNKFLSSIMIYKRFDHGWVRVGSINWMMVVVEVLEGPVLGGHF